MIRDALLTLMLCLCSTGCSERVGASDESSAGATGGSGQGGSFPLDEGEVVNVQVPAEGAVLVDLDGPAVLDTTDTSTGQWELAFSGYDVLTTSGVSGPGSGGAFGPLSAPTFLANSAPAIPFLIEDRLGGAFLGWYAYEGTTHALWSRHHVYGVRDGDDLYKVQVLGYYGEVEGAPVSAVYRLRWAAVTSSGVGPTQEVDDLDGTAGGLGGTDDDPSGCLDLGTGARAAISVAEARASSAWHLCFRRDAISVNGELGGPRGVGAVDVTRDARREDLPLDEVKLKTPEGELAAFEGVDHARLSDASLVYRGDRVVSAFGTAWYEAGDPPRPANNTWLVQSSDGARPFLVFFDGFEGAGKETPGTLTLRVKAVSP